MSNWRNPNNWHWTSKNCLNWAKDYFGKELIDVSVEQDGTTVKTDKLTDCTGDVDLSQRKGKLITIYDVALTIEYSGTSAAGNSVKGEIKFLEVAHDTDLNDLTYTVTADEDADDYEIVKEVARKHLIPALKEKLGKFANDLVETHRTDVYIDPSQMGATSTPRPVTPIASSSDISSQKSSSGSTPTSSTSAKTLLNTKSIKETIEFQTSADQLYETLLDPGRVAAWTRARPDIFKTVGSHYSLFDGNITGVMHELVPNEKITQTWRLKSWPEGHYSDVTMTFQQTSDNTKLHLTQTGVPVGEVDVVRNNWQTFYWNPIKSVFGYGSISSSSSSSSSAKTPHRSSSGSGRGSGSGSNRKKKKSQRDKKGSSGNGLGVGIVTAIVLTTAIVLGFIFASRSS